MKNKKTTYLLICAVAVVWGIILYRIFFNDPAADGPPAVSIIKKEEPYDQYVAINDTFKLALNYRDPFLGKASSAARTDTATVNKAKTHQQNRQSIEAQATLPTINWALVTYTGYITNPVTKKTVAILSVNGQERMVGEGESFQGVKLLKNKKDSILVKWQGKQKYIRQ